MVKRVLIMAGGTGGHVFPALAVAKEIQNLGVEIIWMGTKKGIESVVVPQHGIGISWITISGLRGVGMKSWILAPVRMLIAIFQAVLILLKTRPVAVLGMGGFVSGPGGVAAWLLRKPLVIHEQNAVAGLTNRFLSKMATHVFCAFPGALPSIPEVNIIGNPVRSQMTLASMPHKRFLDRSGPLRLLVLGGSQGAMAINKIVPKAIAEIPVSERPIIRIQCGIRHLDETTLIFNDVHVDAKIESFIDDMASAYQWADIVLCRSGALTVAELSAIGVASILVPYPYAVDDHQFYNGESLIQADAAWMVREKDLDVAYLKNIFQKLLNYGKHEAGMSSSLTAARKKLLKMALNAKKLSRPNAAKDVANCCVGLTMV